MIHCSVRHKCHDVAWNTMHTAALVVVAVGAVAMKRNEAGVGIRDIGSIPVR